MVYITHLCGILLLTQAHPKMPCIYTSYHKLASYLCIHLLAIQLVDGYITYYSIHYLCASACASPLILIEA